MDTKEKAILLRLLHKKGDPLVLVNAWDAASALVFEKAGCKAIATTSAGLAHALGYPDGQKLPWKELVGAVRRITRVATLPLTVDIEAGFSDNEATLERNITELIEAGAVGVNLEDAVPDSPQKQLCPPDRQVVKIRAVQKAAEAAGVPIVLNARTDAYWSGLEEAEEVRIRKTVERGMVYADAGADCIFVPGAREAKVIGRLVEEIDACINILAVKGTPHVSELARLGVGRVSLGSGPTRAAYTRALHMAKEVLEKGSYEEVLEGAMTYEEFGRLFSA